MKKEDHKINIVDFHNAHQKQLSELLNNEWSPEFTLNSPHFMMFIVKPDGDIFSKLEITEKAISLLTEEEIHNRISSTLNKALKEINK